MIRTSRQPTVENSSFIISEGEMTVAQFNAMMERGLFQAKAGQGLDVDDAFRKIEESI